MSTETPEKPPALTTVQILKLLIGIIVFGVLMGWRTDFEQPWQRSVVAGCAAALATLKGLYIDCGWRDQYHIHYGSRILSQRLAELGIRHTYEEFDDNHSDVDYRMDVSLPFLYRALKP